MKEEEYDVIVIGGGASGMMAAGVAASRGKRVLLLERNKRLGEKLRITGGGRCNIANAEPDVKKLLANYKGAEQFLYSSFSKFGMKDTFSFFESKKLPLVVQARQRAFPKSEKASDVAMVLTDFLDTTGVIVQTNTRISQIEGKDGNVTRILAGNKAYTAKSYILATGGVSHPETGSTGDGFSWLRALGHTIENPTPTIVPLKVKETWIKKLQGATLPDVRISFFVEGKKRLSRKGNILCTHFGISGPTILNVAGDVADLEYEGVVSAVIDLYPGMDLGILDRHITSVFDANKNKYLKNVFKEITPPGTSEVLLTLVPALDGEKKVHSVTKEERRALAELLKSLPLTITGLMGFERAVVADGGLVLSEVDMKTMRSTKYKNLYVTGDLLHIQRPSGGYSLQLCWTTGYVAGMSVSE